ncbi:hypothetical protein M569_13928 [Genlisea aurea]|uniref:Uncharacterized protein n=1 Tax=Genlisea aurea TaxID=192259 RepID=S8DDR6_9LAMI|nr:hypothetical protein M569_13928 [Genlisea aurea]
MKTIDAYLKKRRDDTEIDVATPPETRTEIRAPSIEVGQEKTTGIEVLFKGIDFLERDPGLRPQIWQYPINERDEVKELIKLVHCRDQVIQGGVLT